MNKLKKYAASRSGRDTLLSFGIVIVAFVVVQAQHFQLDEGLACADLRVYHHGGVA